MTDIRRHGFDSDAQWREHLDEIEEAAAESAEAAERRRTSRELAALRAEVASLRRRVAARALREPASPRWPLLGAGVLLLFLALLPAFRRRLTDSRGTYLRHSR